MKFVISSNQQGPAFHAQMTPIVIPWASALYPLSENEECEVLDFESLVPSPLQLCENVREPNAVHSVVGSYWFAYLSDIFGLFI